MARAKILTRYKSSRPEHASSRKRSRCLGPKFMAFDTADNLYVSNSCAFTGCPAKPAPPGIVNVYAPNATKPQRTIRLGSSYASRLGVNGSNNLFVAQSELHANAACPPGITFSNVKIAVYAPGAASPKIRIVSGLPQTIPVVPIMDATGGFYVARNEQSCPSCKPTNLLMFYGPQAMRPTRTVTTKYFIAGVTLTPSGNLYALEQPVSANCEIEEYASELERPVRTIRTSIPYCESIVSTPSEPVHRRSRGKPISVHYRTRSRW